MDSGDLSAIATAGDPTFGAALAADTSEL